MLTNLGLLAKLRLTVAEYSVLPSEISRLILKPTGAGNKILTEEETLSFEC